MLVLGLGLGLGLVLVSADSTVLYKYCPNCSSCVPRHHYYYEYNVIYCANKK